MVSTPDTSTPARSWTAHLLLAQRPPGGLADIMDTLQPGAGARLQGPTPPAIGVPVRDERFLLGLFDPIQDDALAVDATNSPIRSYVEPAAQQHQAVISVFPQDATTARAEQSALALLLTRLAERDDVTAVWLPHQSILTTDVLYLGETSERETHAYFRVHAMQLDPAAGTSHAFTRGLAPLLGREVQLSGTTIGPATLYTELRAVLCDVVEGDRALVAGDQLRIGQDAYVVQDGTDLIGTATGEPAPVLDLVPAAGAAEPAWAAYVLFPTSLANAGDALEGYLPNRAELLRQSGASEFTIPVGEVGVSGRVLGPIADPALERDAQTGDSALMPAVAQHQAVLRVALTRPTDTRTAIDDVSAVLLGLAESGTPAQAIWLPHQERVITPQHVVDCINGNRARSLWYAVHARPDEGAPGRARAYTRGLGVLGIPEVVLRGSSLSVEELPAKLWNELDIDISQDRTPKAGQKLRLNKTWYAYTDGVDERGESALELVAQRGRDAEAETPAAGTEAKKRGWFRRG